GRRNRCDRPAPPPAWAAAGGSSTFSLPLPSRTTCTSGASPATSPGAGTPTGWVASPRCSEDTRVPRAGTDRAARRGTTTSPPTVRLRVSRTYRFLLMRRLMENPPWGSVRPVVRVRPERRSRALLTASRAAPTCRAREQEPDRQEPHERLRRNSYKLACFMILRKYETPGVGGDA